MIVQCASSYSINGSNEKLGYELSPLGQIHLIEDGALRFCHIVREEEASCNTCRWMFIENSSDANMSMGVLGHI